MLLHKVSRIGLPLSLIGVISSYYYEDHTSGVLCNPICNLSQSNNRPTTVIIGSGVIGVSTAYYLSILGHKVICIDSSSKIANETSYKNGALICPSLLNPWANSGVISKFLKSLVGLAPDTIKIRSGALLDSNFYYFLFHYIRNCTDSATKRNSNSLFALSNYSMQCLQQIQSEFRLDYGKNALGTLQLAKTEASIEAIYNASKPIVENGGHITVMNTPEKLIEFEPSLSPIKDKLQGAIFSNMDSNGDINLFTTKLADILQKQYDVEFRLNSKVVDFIKEDRTKIDTQSNTNTTNSLNNYLPRSNTNIVTQHHNTNTQITPVAKASLVNLDLLNSVHSINNTISRSIRGVVLESGEIIQADNFVVANGNHITKLLKPLGLTIPVYPIKGYVCEVAYKTPTIETTQKELENFNFIRPKYNLVDDATKLYISPMKDYIRISGLAEFEGFKHIGEIRDKQRAHSLLLNTLYWLPNNLDINNVQYHSCSRPLSCDDVPYIGQLLPYNNLYINGGFGSKGWTLCFGAAKLLSTMINRDIQLPIDPTPYNPNRFAHFFGNSNSTKQQ